jgi:transposase-like protein
MDTKGKETSAAAGLNWRNKPRRIFKPEERLAMVRECAAPGVSVAEVAQRNRVNTNLLFKWKRMHERGLLPVPASEGALVPVRVVKRPRRTAVRVKRQADLRRVAPVVAGGAIDLEIAGVRIILHGAVNETNLAVVLRALARR